MKLKIIPIFLCTFVLVNGQQKYLIRNKYQSEVNEDINHHIIPLPPDSIPAEEHIQANDNNSENCKTCNKRAIKLKRFGQENQVPFDILEKINQVRNVSQFLEEFIDEESLDPREGGIKFLSSSSNVERSRGIDPKPAGCIPENTVVPLDPLNPSLDPNVVYFPTCTRVKRCSGCCHSLLLSCQPTKVETLAFTIHKSKFTGGPKMAYLGKEIVLVDEHQQCKCDCKVKEKDCNAYQIYEGSRCECVCANFDEREKCFANSEKIWDSQDCTCRCRIPGNCTSGSYFDENQCRCIAGDERKKQVIKAIEDTTHEN